MTPEVQELYSEWCKDTKRNGGILISKSIQEWSDHLYNSRQQEVDGLNKEVLEANRRVLYIQEREGKLLYEVERLKAELDKANKWISELVNREPSPPKP